MEFIGSINLDPTRIFPLRNQKFNIYYTCFLLLTPGSGRVPRVNRIVEWIMIIVRGSKLLRDIAKIGTAILFLMFVFK